MRGCIWAILVFAAMAAAPAAFAQANPDFAGDVEPIFKRRCQMCHNVRLKSNGLRLDDGAAALEGGYSGPVILPGKSAESKLIHRITSDKAGFRMPPAGRAAHRRGEIATLQDLDRLRGSLAAHSSRQVLLRRKLPLVLPAHHPTRSSFAEECRLGPQSHRQLHPRPPRKGVGRPLA